MYGPAGHGYAPGQPKLKSYGDNKRRVVKDQSERKAKTGKHAYGSKTKKGGLKYAEVD